MKKPTPFLFRLVLQLVLITAAFLGGMMTQSRLGAVQAAAPEATNPQPDFTTFTRVWNLVYDQYVDRKAIDPQKMMYGAIEGMLDTLGDSGHTHFSPPSKGGISSIENNGQFEGIGATVGTRDGQIVITSPLPGSPAERAGIRAGDVVLQIDGAATAGLSLDQVISRVRGPKGTSVRLTVLHTGQAEPVDITIVRDIISLPRTSWAMIPGTQVAHIRLYQFSNGMAREAIQEIQAARAAGAKALVIDVRDNPGGLLEETVRMTSQFLKEGNVLLEQDSQGKRTPSLVRGGGVATELPLVVLTDYGTASASEILAGALQDYGRATVIGTRTFGTGTVLSTFRMQDGGELVLGTAEWLTPKGRFIKGNGIQPDKVVRLNEGALSLLPEKEKNMTEAEFQSSNDNQLQTAVQMLLGDLRSARFDE